MIKINADQDKLEQISKQDSLAALITVGITYIPVELFATLSGFTPLLVFKLPWELHSTQHPVSMAISEALGAWLLK